MKKMNLKFMWIVFAFLSAVSLLACGSSGGGGGESSDGGSNTPEPQYQYVETIDMTGYSIDDLASDGTNLIVLYNDWPDNVGIFDLSGNIISSFNTLGAFSTGITYNGNKIIYSGGINYTGALFEMNPLDGSVTGPMATAGYTQPYLAFDGLNILASGQALGNNGVFDIPINKFDASTYQNLGTFSVTVLTGTNASAVSRSVIAWNNDNLFTALSIGGMNKIYQFDSSLNLVDAITISQITTGQAIQSITFVNDDLFIANTIVDEIYRYTLVP